MLSAVNPSLTGSCDKAFASEPQYEDIDKYDYLVKGVGGDEAYEKMKSVQLVMPHANTGNGHVIPAHGHVTTTGQGYYHQEEHAIHVMANGQGHMILSHDHMTRSQGHMIHNHGHMTHNQGHVINPSEYDYAAVH